MNELQRNEKTEYRSNGIDLFSYLMRNEKTVSHPPTGFNTFLQGILDANIPLGWIERLRKLSNGENLLEATETRPKKWTSWKDLSNQDSSPESQKNSASKLDDMERLKSFTTILRNQAHLEVSKD
ncbi:uncharacterized protein TNCV_4222781 [Trichonephila clavipes]|nr:uncharacterized protein TNCV_4222781 [Trichonephila clavipes]